MAFSRKSKKNKSKKEKLKEKSEEEKRRTYKQHFSKILNKKNKGKRKG